jgi:hypothetical protein
MKCCLSIGMAIQYFKKTDIRKITQAASNRRYNNNNQYQPKPNPLRHFNIQQNQCKQNDILCKNFGSYPYVYDSPIKIDMMLGKLKGLTKK